MRNNRLRLFSGLMCLLVSVVIGSAAMAQSTPNAPAPDKNRFKPALLYVTGKQDSERAFINMARGGADKAKAELGISFDEYRMPENEDGTAFIRSIAEKGYSPIIAVGYQNVLPVLNLAQQFPSTRFTVIDGLVPPLYQNVQSIIFKDHEGSFLVGMIAAYTSKTGKIGFIGGMDVPLIRNFGLGFSQGAKFVRPTISIQSDMVGDTPEAWSQPEIAYELARKQYAAGVDVIFSAAGGSGLGVLRASKDDNKYAIGVDTNQNALYPGNVLTSMVKRVDVAVFDTLRNSHEGKWEPGIKSLGLKESALDFSVDTNNKHLITDDLVEQVLITRERIINGLIDVNMYSPN